MDFSLDVKPISNFTFNVTVLYISNRHHALVRGIGFFHGDKTKIVCPMLVIAVVNVLVHHEKSLLGAEC
jgi:hypothetical protein